MTTYDDVRGSEVYQPSLPVNLLLMTVSLGLASIVGFYLHPHLLPVVAEAMPRLWSAAQGWMTAPILFVFVNMVVGTLYFSSRMLPKACHEKIQARRDAQRSVPTRPVDMVTSDRVAYRDNETMGSAPETNNEAAPPAPEPIPATSRPLSGLRARIEKSTTFGRLVRSNSEQIPSALSASGKYTDGSRLKKAGTFEGVMGARPRKPVVVIADPPEDDSDRDPARGTEVDKKAEDFISRFYEKMKLQRIDSLVRRQREAASR